MTEKRFEQYLRENPMPTQGVDNNNYFIVECKCQFMRIDEKVI